MQAAEILRFTDEKLGYTNNDPSMALEWALKFCIVYYDDWMGREDLRCRIGDTL